MSASATMPERRLDDVCDLITDGTHQSPANGPEGDYLYVTSKNIRDGYLDLSHVTFVPRDVHEEIYARSPVREGDVLYVKDGVNTGTAAINTLREPFSLLSSVALIRPSADALDAGYLRHWLSSPIAHRRMMQSMSGTAIRRLVLREIKASKIPLPPLPEQRRIAAILDKADAVRRKRQQTLDLADQFLRSAFLDLFGDPVTNPKGWPVRKLGDVLVGIEGGWSAKGEDRTPQPGEKAVLKISAVTSGVYRPEECKVVADLGRRDVIVPRIGDVLFSRANTRELVAATCLVDRDVPAVFLPDKLWRLVPNTDEIQGPYLRFALNTHSLRALIRRRATGTSGSMLNVSMAKLRGVPIPLPDVARQRRFGRALARQQALIHRAQDAADGCESLASVLAQRAFREEL